jgi:hypothetical protein
MYNTTKEESCICLNMVSIKRAIIFGSIPAAVVLMVILLAAFYAKEVYTQIDIQAPNERVWHILTNFTDFHEWNPFMDQASGEIRQGVIVTIHLQPINTQGMTINPTITKVESNHELRWLGRFGGIPRLFDGEHILTIESIGNNHNLTHFIQREVYRGVLVPFYAFQLDTSYRPAFEAMNHALKMKSERTNG